MEKKNSFLALKFSMRRRMFSALQLCASSIGLPKSEEASGFAPFVIVQDRRITEGELGNEWTRYLFQEKFHHFDVSPADSVACSMRLNAKAEQQQRERERESEKRTAKEIPPRWTWS